MWLSATSCHNTALDRAPVGRGAFLSSLQAPPLPWVVSLLAVLTNPEWSQLTGPCRPHSLPHCSLQAHLVSAVGSPVAWGAVLPLPGFPATWIPGTLRYYTHCPLCFGIQRSCHTASHMHTHGCRGTAHTYLQDEDVQKSLTICELRREPAARESHQASGHCW